MQAKSWLVPIKLYSQKYAECRIWSMNYSLLTPGLVIKITYRNRQLYQRVSCFVTKLFFELKEKVQFCLGEIRGVHSRVNDTMWGL